MKIAIITIAGVSSRFNEGVAEENKRLKAIYYEKDEKQTLLYHLLQKCLWADRIIVVGGYKYRDVEEYCVSLGEDLESKISLVYNENYEKYGSGYSLYVGIVEALKYNPEEILFVEGDLDIDADSFEKVVGTSGNVLTYTYEPIYADRAVVLYRDAKGIYRYAFNSNHGLLLIEDSFSCILNSGQVWKFMEPNKLALAAEAFYKESISATNLQIIQRYLDMGVTVNVIPLDRWVNCNTRSDYIKIVSYWEKE